MLRVQDCYWCTMIIIVFKNDWETSITPNMPSFNYMKDGQGTLARTWIFTWFLMDFYWLAIHNHQRAGQFGEHTVQSSQRTKLIGSLNVSSKVTSFKKL